MLKAKIGFIPSNWEDWNRMNLELWKKNNWAEKMRDRCVTVFNEIPGMELIVPAKDMTLHGCVSDRIEAKKVLELFKKENIDGLLIGNMTFGSEVAVSTILNGLTRDIPILHFNTRSGPIRANGMRSTDNWCGQFMITSAIKRRGFNFIHLNTSDPEDDTFKYNIEIFTRAVCAISNFVGLRVAQLGTRPMAYESENWSEQAMQKKFRQSVVPMDLDAVLATIENVEPENPEVKKIISEITNGVDVSEHTEESITNLARGELGFIQIAEELDVNALAVNCWTGIEERLHIAPCSILGRLNDKGIMSACEVDVYGAVSMWAMFTASLGLATPHFIDWTDLHPDKPDIWLAWHCGNASRSLCAKGCKPRLVKNPQLINWVTECHGALECRLKEGPVTCGRLVEYDGEFTMFFGNGEIIDIEPFVRGAYGWVKVNDVFDWEKKLVESGMIHHGVLIHEQKVADSLEMFCKFLDIKAVRGA